MSEMAKTVVFVAVAAASLLLGFIVDPSADNFNVEDQIGERLHQFEIEAPKRLKIVKFDQDTATTHEFEVANDNGLWTIPSKQGYPADAAKQMAEAATCLIDRQILKVAATSASEHQELGVVDPSSSNLGSNSDGVGIHVTMTDSNDQELVDMIIGKTVKDAEGQHFVRNADQDVVYVVELNSDKLSTQFEDWIEKDLLQLNPLDIRRVQIKDYTAELQQSPLGGQTKVLWDRRAEIALKYDNADSKWTAESLQQFDAQQQEYIERVLAEDEELNEEALTELRNGLDELLLVDVERKPSGLSTDLKAGSEFLDNKEAIFSLVDRGFAPLQLGEDSGVEILSSEGEVICTLADGVEYVLRFGNLNLDSETSAEAAPAADEEPEENASSGIHRYMFLMARFNEGMLEQPELDELPELPSEPASASGKSGEPASAGGNEDEDEDANDSENEATGESEADTTENQEPNDDSEAEEATDDTTETETETEDSEADATEGDATEKDTAEDEKADELKSLIAARKMIETENQRRLSEYQDKLEASQERVQELNERFGDWYYVISDEVYKKIRLSLDQVIRVKEKEEGEENAASEAPLETGLPGLPSLPVESDEAEAEPESKPEAETEPSAEPESEPESEPKPEPESKSADESEAESKTEAEPESEVEVETEPEVEAETEAETEAEAAAE